MNVGDKLPEVLGVDQDGKEVKLSDYAGRKLVLYVYPKDNTPGCSAEAQSMRDNLAELQKQGYEVIGVSKDSAASHKKFIDKYSLNFPLISDVDTSLLQTLGAWGEKTMCGRKTIGALRTTYLTDENGVITRIFEPKEIKTKEHANQILKYLMASLLCLLAVLPVDAQNPRPKDKDIYGWLYCHMSRKGEFTAFAISRDGINFQDLNDGNEVYDTKALSRIEQGARDAFISRAHNNKGYVMVTTDMKVANSKHWFNYGIDLLRSKDLINWESVTFDFRKGPEIFCDPESPDFYEDYSKINRVWAPQTMWDPNYVWPNGEKGGYFIYYSMLSSNEGDYDRIFYSYADKSFTKLTKPQVLIDWGYATIDTDINWIEADQKWHILIKKEGGKPGIFTTSAEKLTGPYAEPVEHDFVSFEGNRKCEGPSAYRLPGEKTWRIAYVEYSSNPSKYRTCQADENMRNFHSPTDIVGVADPQHGSFMPLTKKEYKRLEKAWK